MGGVFSDCSAPRELDLGCSHMQEQNYQHGGRQTPGGIRASNPQQNQSQSKRPISNMNLDDLEKLYGMCSSNDEMDSSNYEADGTDEDEDSDSPSKPQEATLDGDVEADDEQIEGADEDDEDEGEEDEEDENDQDDTDEPENTNLSDAQMDAGDLSQDDKENYLYVTTEHEDSPQKGNLNDSSILASSDPANQTKIAIMIGHIKQGGAKRVSQLDPRELKVFQSGEPSVPGSGKQPAPAKGKKKQGLNGAKKATTGDQQALGQRARASAELAKKQSKLQLVQNVDLLHEAWMRQGGDMEPGQAPGRAAARSKSKNRKKSKPKLKDANKEQRKSLKKLVPFQNEVNAALEDSPVAKQHETKKRKEKRQIIKLMKQQFQEAESSSSSDEFDKYGKRAEQNSVAMAKELAILRLLKRNHKLKSAFQKNIEHKPAAPVQVDPYMLKQLFEEFQAVEAENNGGQAPQAQQQLLFKQEILNQITGENGKDSPDISALGSQGGGRGRRQSNFSVYLRQKLSAVAGENTDLEPQSDLDLNFEAESMIALSRRDKGYSFAVASESDITNRLETDGEEGEGGACDYDLDEIAAQLGIEQMQRLNSIMRGDGGRDPEAFMDAMVEALAEASQGGKEWVFARDHAPSGFELESNLDDIIGYMEKRSSVAGGRSRVDGASQEDEEYVALSQYEMDLDLEEVKKMTELGPPTAAQTPSDFQRLHSHAMDALNEAMDMEDMEPENQRMARLASMATHDQLKGNLNLDLGMIARHSKHMSGKNSHRVHFGGADNGMMQVGAHNLSCSSKSDDEDCEDDASGGKPRTQRRFQHAYGSSPNMIRRKTSQRPSRALGFDAARQGMGMRGAPEKAPKRRDGNAKIKVRSHSQNKPRHVKRASKNAKDLDDQNHAAEEGKDGGDRNSDVEIVIGEHHMRPKMHSQFKLIGEMK